MLFSCNSFVIFHAVFHQLCMKFSFIGTMCVGRCGKCVPDWSVDSIVGLSVMCLVVHLLEHVYGLLVFVSDGSWSLYLMQLRVLIVGLQLFSLVKLVVSTLSSHS